MRRKIADALAVTSGLLILLVSILFALAQS
jgi:hypothetical protein